MLGKPHILSLFLNLFNKFNKTETRMLDSIYHMTLKLLKNSIFGVKTLRFNGSYNEGQIIIGVCMVPMYCYCVVCAAFVTGQYKVSNPNAAAILYAMVVKNDRNIYF